MALSPDVFALSEGRAEGSCNSERSQELPWGGQGPTYPIRFQIHIRGLHFTWGWGSSGFQSGSHGLSLEVRCHVASLFHLWPIGLPSEK